MKSYYFVSDLHLGTGDDSQRQARFFQFLSLIREHAAGLIILGDLLEFGFEYHDGLAPANAAIAQQLARLPESGVPVTLLSGNHDYWLGLRFQAQYRIQVEPLPVTMVLNGMRCYLAHGDELDRSMVNQFSRRLFRSRFATRSYSLLPKSVGTKIAVRIARGARANRENIELAQVFEHFAARRLQQDCDAVVLGHIHQPSLRRIGSGWYLNTGDWLKHYSYGVLKEGEFHLQHF